MTFTIKTIAKTAALGLCAAAIAGTSLANDGYAMMAGSQSYAQNMHMNDMSDGLYEVALNKNELVRLPAPASAVIIADPDVADVSVHSSDTLLVIGRGYGETNLIVLDEAGRTMMNADIVVSAPRSKGTVRLYRAGSDRETYSCRPDCMPAPVLGDGADYVRSFGGSGDTITNPVASAPITNALSAPAPNNVGPR